MAPSALPGTPRPASTEPDPREQETWFRELPESAKQRYREQFEKDARRHEVDLERQRDRWVQSMVEGAAMYLLLELFVYGFSIWALLVTVAIGALVGTVWHKLQTGRGLSAFAGIGGFLVVRMACGMGSPFHAMCALLLVTCLSFAFAIPRDSQLMGA